MTSGPLAPVFHPEAEAEFNAAIDWYEARGPGLGLEFAAEVRAAVGRAVALPLAWQAVDGEIRRSLVHRYPYGVLYAPEPGRLFIVAVMHLRQRPGYWRSRVG